MSEQWPTADIDSIAALHVLAAVTPGAVVVETHVAKPFDDAWEIAGDLERALPRCVTDLRTFTITARDGDRLVATARGHSGLRARFDVVLRPGWCVMRSRFLLGGLAVAATPTGVRFACLGGLRLPGLGLVAPLLRRLARPLIARIVSRYAERIRAGSDRP